MCSRYSVYLATIGSSSLATNLSRELLRNCRLSMNCRYPTLKLMYFSMLLGTHTSFSSSVMVPSAWMIK